MSNTFLRVEEVAEEMEVSKYERWSSRMLRRSLQTIWEICWSLCAGRNGVQLPC